jgi:hypothetical protein
MRPGQHVAGGAEPNGTELLQSRRSDGTTCSQRRRLGPDARRMTIVSRALPALATSLGSAPAARQAAAAARDTLWPMSTVDFSALSIDGKGADDREIVDRQLRIRGGQPLHGDVRVRGAKNTLPKNMVASLLTDETCVLVNVAGVVDVEIAAQMIDALGGSVGKPRSGELTMRTVDPEVLSSDRLAYFAGRSRIPVLI